MKILIKFFMVVSLFITLTTNATIVIKPALWQVEHQGNISYIFGSIHIGAADWYPLPDKVSQAYNASQSLVVELDALASAQQLQYAMLLKSGEKLSQKMSASTYKKLSEYTQSHGIPIASLERLKPWAVATVVAVLPYMKQGLSPEFGIDSYFLKMAKHQKKSIVELETPQFQLSILEGAFSQEDALLELMALPDSEVAKLIEYWKQGDMAKLDVLAKSQMSVSQIEQMLTQRNNNWVGKIKALMSSTQQQFIVVGAAHLAGKDGVPQLLKRQGFKVTRIE